MPPDIVSYIANRDNKSACKPTFVLTDRRDRTQEGSCSMLSRDHGGGLSCDSATSETTTHAIDWAEGQTP